MTRRRELYMTVAVGLSVSFGGGQIASAEELHTAQEGDTVASIAEAHGVSVDALAEVNSLDPAAQLYADQDLTIPDRSSSSQIYVVESGDTIASIATARGVSIDAILASNDVADVQDLRVGVELVIPTGATSVTAADSGSAATILNGVFAYQQARSLSCATSGDTGFYETDETGTYKLVPYEHVVVAYGYDNGGVYIADPGNASLTYYNWDWFLSAWSVMDGMALSIYPA